MTKILQKFQKVIFLGISCVRCNQTQAAVAGYIFNFNYTFDLLKTYRYVIIIIHIVIFERSISVHILRSDRLIYTTHFLSLGSRLSSSVLSLCIHASIILQTRFYSSFNCSIILSAVGVKFIIQNSNIPIVISFTFTSCQ